MLVYHCIPAAEAVSEELASPDTSNSHNYQCGLRKKPQLNTNRLNTNAIFGKIAK